MKIAFWASFIFVNTLFASVKSAYVEASLELAPNAPNSLIYSYRIVNGRGSKVPVKTFVIDVRGRSEAVSLTSESTPAGWTFMGLREEGITWAANDKGLGVNQTSGFLKLKSDGLPAIRIYRLAPGIEGTKIPISPPQDSSELKAYLKKVEDFKRRNEAQGVTLAPVAPPNPFVPLAFVDIILQGLQEIIEKGFQSKNSATSELVQKLRVIRTALENNDQTSARSLSESLMTRLGFQKSSVLTVEVIAFVKFNLRFLVSQLRGVH